MNNRLTPITDDRGRCLLPPEEMFEPHPGSIVLTSGAHGTAWQRQFSDGRWYNTRGESLEWKGLVRRRNVVLVYDAPERPDTKAEQRAASKAGQR